MFAVLPPPSENSPFSPVPELPPHPTRESSTSTTPNFDTGMSSIDTRKHSSSGGPHSNHFFFSSPLKPSTTDSLSATRSSPVRPLSPLSGNAKINSLAPPHYYRGNEGLRGARDVQSSPITSSFAPKTFSFGMENSFPFWDEGRRSLPSKFASRPSRPNPLTAKREDRQETRRKLFLQNVKARGEEKRWQSRGGDDGILKLDFQATTANWRASKERDASNLIINDEDIEELARLEELSHFEQRAELDQPFQSSANHSWQVPDEEMDLADEILQQEEAELDQLVSTFSQEQRDTIPTFASWRSQTSHPGSQDPMQSQSSMSYPVQPTAHPDSDFGGEEYDDIFMDFIEHGDVAGGSERMMDVEML